MQVNNYASDLAVKMFESSISAELERMMNTWLSTYPLMFVCGIEMGTVTHPGTNEIQYTAIIVYQPSELNEEQ
ncbi:hypothetical protein HUB98_05225 [Paenibacillus barcinonensis]|uniref:Uncharacterized protein n=1 Tax=Paenibacillus barcinonensis TaxID=198119 RepID=A0A2V4VCY0_PAEBA|nr:hypothetical protein [Paenibacillus barcinonensis]PYE51388.1 hypothetical protein DFQ00_102182 [Paenibacillus barcinonensis]QKS55784.1 hypothetical protein HUB98_05225 [Paenibacillus barcinonensis]